MQEVKVVIHNYKKLKETEFDITGGSVFFMQGPNEVGKTSFVNLLKAIMEVKDDTVNPVTYEEKEGYAVGTIPGADGKQYQFRYDFNIDGKKKFTFIGPDNKSVKSVTDMRAIFNYTHFTVEEFYNWSMTAAGRQKQKNILLMLLSDSERLEVAQIEGKVNSTSGEIFLQRQTVNRDISYLEGVIEKGGLNSVQKDTLSKKKAIDELYDEFVNQKKIIDEYVQNNSTHAIRLKSAQEARDTAVSNYTTTVTQLDTSIADIEKQIRELTESLGAKKELLKTTENAFLEKKVILDKAVTDLEADYDVKKMEEYMLVLNGDGTEKNPGINARINAGKAKKDEIIKLETISEQFNKNKEDLAVKQKQADEYTEKIDTLRKRKESIISNSDNIPHDYQIGDDYITVDGIPFVETDLSKSHAVKAIAKLMMKVNKAPIMLMGDAENLGYTVLNELQEEAEKSGKIMIFAEHVRDLEEIKLVCYDELDHGPAPKKPNTNLF